MKKVILAAILTVLSLTAQSGLIAPRVGFIRDARDALIPVHGIRANFILGRPVLDGVRAVAFSGTFGLAKTDEGVLVLDSQANPIAKMPSAGDTALFAFRQDGLPALVYVPETKELFRWEGKSLTRVEWSASGFTGEPVALAQLGGRKLAMVERRAESLWIVHRDLRSGLVRFEAILPGAFWPVFLSADGTLIWRSSEGLTVRRRGGSEQRLTLGAEPTGFEQIGEGWVRVRTERSGGLAIRTSGVDAQIYRLPGGMR